MIPAFLLAPLARYGAAALVGAALGAWVTDSLKAGQIGRLEAKVAEERLAHQADLKAVSDAAAAAQLENQRAVQRMQAEIADADARHTEDLRHAQTETDRLRADLRSGARRMHVTAVCRPSRRSGMPGATITSRLGDADTGTIELPAGIAEDLAALAGRADAITQQLRACQAYARTVSRRP